MKRRTMAKVITEADAIERMSEDIDQLRVRVDRLKQPASAPATQTWSPDRDGVSYVGPRPPVHLLAGLRVVEATLAQMDADPKRPYPTSLQLLLEGGASLLVSTAHPMRLVVSSAARAIATEPVHHAHVGDRLAEVLDAFRRRIPADVFPDLVSAVMGVL